MMIVITVLYNTIHLMVFEYKSQCVIWHGLARKVCEKGRVDGGPIEALIGLSSVRPPVASGPADRAFGA